MVPVKLKLIQQLDVLVLKSDFIRKVDSIDNNEGLRRLKRKLLNDLKVLKGHITNNALSVRVLLIALTAIILPALLPLNSAYAKDKLKMSLVASKVTVDQNGNTVYIPVSTAKPGTTIQYQATYTNESDYDIYNAVVTLPIPTNTRFTGQAYPPSAKATIDYYNYYHIPLMNVIDGGVVKIPYTDYKALRWDIRYLPAHKSIKVAFNTVVF